MLFDEENGYTPEYIYGNYFERLMMGKGRREKMEKEAEAAAAEAKEEESEQKVENMGLRELIDGGDFAGSRILHQSRNAGARGVNIQTGEEVAIKLKSKRTAIPAIEVEPPGCSFNPEDESHKDSLALAVAEEMKKVYNKELQPEPIPLTVPGEPITEDDRYFLEVDKGDDDELDEENQIDGGNNEDEKRKTKVKPVTTVEKNKRIRRKEQLKAEAEAKKIKGLSKEIDSIPDILQEIAEEDEEKKNKHLRRLTAKEDRLKSFPPRIGRQKFKPAPTQVLLTEEITGSLRKLKACYTLARDRFKSLEKRGLVIPSVKSSRGA